MFAQLTPSLQFDLVMLFLPMPSDAMTICRPDFPDFDSVLTLYLTFVTLGTADDF